MAWYVGVQWHGTQERTLELKLLRMDAGLCMVECGGSAEAVAQGQAVAGSAVTICIEGILS